MGVSGSGKSTLLRLVAGLERPDQGEVILDGQIASSPRRILPPEQRQSAMVFQESSLWPHLSAMDHLQLVAPAGTAYEFLAGLLARLGLDGQHEAMPGQLSGGERRRLEIARALARRARLLLLDEPLTGLDAALHREMLGFLAAWAREHGITVLYATHNAIEAVSFASRIALLFEGRLIQTGSPEEVYRHPVSPLAASLLGACSLLPARIVVGGRLSCSLGEFAADGNHVPGDGWACFRPHELQISALNGDEPGHIEQRYFQNGVWLYQVRLRDAMVFVQAAEKWENGAAVGIRPCGNPAFIESKG